MATIKIITKKPLRRDGTCALYYRVRQCRSTRLVHSGYILLAREWDAEREAVLVGADTDSRRMEYLHEAENALHAGRTRLEEIVRRLEGGTSGSYTAEDVVVEYRMSGRPDGFIAFGHRLAAQFARSDRRMPSERYAYVLERFSQYRQGRDLPLREVDEGVMTGFENHLKAGGVSPNTVSYYMRNLRALYNRAVEEGLVEDARPFRRVYTGIDRTRKRAVPLEIVRRIKELDLRHCPPLDYARDLFLFSVYMRGMSFADMAFLKKSDLRDGTVVYRRRKTGRQLVVKWEEAMQAIADKYDSGDTPYLLPIIRHPEDDPRRQYRSALRQVNRKLKTIGQMAGLSVPLSTYAARHTWASLARERHVPLPLISEALGHDSEKTTRIYLASLETTEIDEANRNILDALGCRTKRGEKRGGKDSERGRKCPTALSSSCVEEDNECKNMKDIPKNRKRRGFFFAFWEKEVRLAVHRSTIFSSFPPINFCLSPVYAACLPLHKRKTSETDKSGFLQALGKRFIKKAYNVLLVNRVDWAKRVHPIFTVCSICSGKSKLK